jgi:hypothetical protein
LQDGRQDFSSFSIVKEQHLLLTSDDRGFCFYAMPGANSLRWELRALVSYTLSLEASHTKLRNGWASTVSSVALWEFGLAHKI